jgi:hypothetical protein
MSTARRERVPSFQRGVKPPTDEGRQQSFRQWKQFSTWTRPPVFINSDDDKNGDDAKTAAQLTRLILSNITPMVSIVSQHGTRVYDIATGRLHYALISSSTTSVKPLASSMLQQSKVVWYPRRHQFPLGIPSAPSLAYACQAKHILSRLALASQCDAGVLSPEASSLSALSLLSSLSWKECCDTILNNESSTYACTLPSGRRWTEPKVKHLSYPVNDLVDIGHGGMMALSPQIGKPVIWYLNT